MWRWVDFLAIGYKPLSRRPATAATREAEDKVDVLIWDGSWRELQQVSSEWYVQRLNKLHQRIQSVRPNRKLISVLLPNDNATPHPSALKGGYCDSGVDSSLSSSLHSPFSTFRLPTFWYPAECSPRKPFCGRRPAETGRVKSSDGQSVLGDRLTASVA